MIATAAAAASRAGKKFSTLRSFTAWSGNLSFSSPEADFYHQTSLSAVDSSAPTWSHSYSYSSPEADFTHIVQDSSYSSSQGQEWSGNLSFASPASDFTAEPEASTKWEWSQQLTFASPESDFQSAANEPSSSEAWNWSEQLSFASPESDFQMASFPTSSHQLDHEIAATLKSSEVMKLAISSPESALGSTHAHHLLEAYQMYQLHANRNLKHADERPLPHTLQEALSASESRAIVVTEAEAPFAVVEVNDAWVGLCGYGKDEARQRSLAALIQGPETNTTALRSMQEELLRGKETSAHVVNYTKAGRKFYNSLRAGPLFDNGKVTHFVGILQEVVEEPDYFHVAHA